METRNVYIILVEKSVERPRPRWKSDTNKSLTREAGCMDRRRMLFLPQIHVKRLNLALVAQAL
jgi:hypothetical protein